MRARRFLENIATYDADGRASLRALYARHDELESKYGFQKEPVYTVKVETRTAQADVTAYCYRSARKGPALWILAGIHGEEPAGPNAIARNIHSLGDLGRDMALVIFPLLNPTGYHRNWRYPDESRDFCIGHSVADSEHYLPDPNVTTQPRVARPRTEIAARVTKFVLDTARDYPPVLTIDHHEDETLDLSYVYSQGHKAAGDEVAKAIIQILTESGMPVRINGHTRFGESIKEGVVVDENNLPVRDGSIDELLAAKQIVVAGELRAKPAALTSLVIETPIAKFTLDKRVEAHGNILMRLRFLWALANQ